MNVSVFVLPFVDSYHLNVNSIVFVLKPLILVFDFRLITRESISTFHMISIIVDDDRKLRCFVCVRGITMGKLCTWFENYWYWCPRIYWFFYWRMRFQRRTHCSGAHNGQTSWPNDSFTLSFRLISGTHFLWGENLYLFPFIRMQ